MSTMHGKRAFRVLRDSCCCITRNSEESRFPSGKSRADFSLETRRERCLTRSSRYRECARWINDPTRNASAAAINPTKNTPPPSLFRTKSTRKPRRKGKETAFSETTNVRFFVEKRERERASKNLAAQFSHFFIFKWKYEIALLISTFSLLRKAGSLALCEFKIKLAIWRPLPNEEYRRPSCCRNPSNPLPSLHGPRSCIFRLDSLIAAYSACTTARHGHLTSPRDTRRLYLHPDTCTPRPSLPRKIGARVCLHPVNPSPLLGKTGVLVPRCGTLIDSLLSLPSLASIITEQSFSSLPSFFAFFSKMRIDCSICMTIGLCELVFFF